MNEIWTSPTEEPSESTPGELQDHIGIISVDSEVSHRRQWPDKLQAVRPKDSESTVFQSVEWMCSLNYWSSKQRHHKVKLKQIFYTCLLLIWMPKFRSSSPHHNHEQLCALLWLQFSQKQPVSRSLIPDQWRVCLLLQKCCSAALPQYKHKDFPFNCPSEHLEPIKAKSWDCPVNGIRFLRWPWDSYRLLKPCQVN